MEKLSEDIEQDLFGAILQTWQVFTAGESSFRLYPVTLGKEMLVRPLLRDINIPAEDMEHLALRAVESRKDIVLRIIAIATLDGREDLLDEARISERIIELSSVTDDADIASLLVIFLREMNKTSRLMEMTGIEKDRKRMAAVQEVKKAGRGTVVFGGVSIYGRLLDVACERYGWTLDYVLWGISATNLQLMLADHVTSIFLSNEELKQIGSDEEEVINGDDPGNNGRLHELLKG